MYNQEIISQLIRFIESQDGIGDKTRLAALVQSRFHLIRKRSVYTSPDFSIRFSQVKEKHRSNTVLALSTLNNYDDRPFFVCMITPEHNKLLLANTTFLKKISHSSQNLRVDHIRGSFNVSDIMEEYFALNNTPQNFPRLYAYHEAFTQGGRTSFAVNLPRLVQNTNNIAGRAETFTCTPAAEDAVLRSVSRTRDFLASPEYQDLVTDLNQRTANAAGEIALASRIDNVNVRGRAIEYLITADACSPLRAQIVNALHTNAPLPEFVTDDSLGDFWKEYHDFLTATDIKSKRLDLNSNPKVYNVDKLLKFLAGERSVYLIYLVGIDGGKIITCLVPALDARLISATKIQKHWAGRNSRGTAQFIGKALSEVLLENVPPRFDPQTAENFLLQLLRS